MPAAQGGALGRFFRGAGYLGRAFALVRQRRELWPLVLAPTLVTTLIAILGAAATYRFARGLVLRHLPGSGGLVHALLYLLLLLVVVAVGYLAFLATSFVATAPFAGPLSERTERIATGAKLPKRSLGAAAAEAVRSVGHTVLSLVLYLGFAGLLAVVHFVMPVLGPPLWFAGILLTGVFVAYDAFDLPLGRRAASFATKWRYVAEHAAEALGFGCTIALFLAVPGVGLFVVPLSCVGGTLLYVDLERAAPPR